MLNPKHERLMQDNVDHRVCVCLHVQECSALLSVLIRGQRIAKSQLYHSSAAIAHVCVSTELLNLDRDPGVWPRSLMAILLS